MSIEVLNESGEADVNEEMLVDVASFALTAMDVHPCTVSSAISWPSECPAASACFLS